MVDNRSAILSNALQLFAARGYDAVGVQEIVDAAGITKPTLYHYFGSKSGLLNALLEEQFTPLIQAVQQATQYHGDLPWTLENLTRVYFHFARDHCTFYRLQLALWYTPRQGEAFKAVTPWNEKLFELIEEMFRQAALQHGNMKDRQRAYATTFIGMINTYVGMALNEYTALDDALTYQAVHQFMHGIFS